MTALSRDQVLARLKQLPSLPSAVSDLLASFGNEDVDVEQIARTRVGAAGPVAERQGDADGGREVVGGQGVDCLIQRDSTLVVELLSQGHGEVVHRLTVIRRLAEVALKLQRGEVQPRLKADDPALQGQHRVCRCGGRLTDDH